MAKWLRRHWTVVLLASVLVAALFEFLVPERRQTRDINESMSGGTPVASAIMRIYAHHCMDTS